MILFLEFQQQLCLLKRCHGHEEATSVLTVPRYSVSILEYFVLKFVVKRLHLVNSRNL